MLVVELDSVVFVGGVRSRVGASALELPDTCGGFADEAHLACRQ